MAALCWPSSGFLPRITSPKPLSYVTVEKRGIVVVFRVDGFVRFQWSSHSIMAMFDVRPHMEMNSSIDDADCRVVSESESENATG